MIKILNIVKKKEKTKIIEPFKLNATVCKIEREKVKNHSNFWRAETDLMEVERMNHFEVEWQWKSSNATGGDYTPCLREDVLAEVGLDGDLMFVEFRLAF